MRHRPSKLIRSKEAIASLAPQRSQECGASRDEVEFIDFLADKAVHVWRATHKDVFAALQILDRLDNLIFEHTGNGWHARQMTLRALPRRSR